MGFGSFWGELYKMLIIIMISDTYRHLFRAGSKNSVALLFGEIHEIIRDPTTPETKSVPKA
jgi:hypothetical protein